ncbi:hypothetical protein BLNAU_16948 [Blattamonas nauphoetae]|uniref:4Fe-4S ferredoxin-type domain-containing protein n=1 Tax=Blattamonas nauphoetae TaxID=2049346 RepID=A0ABQ9X827_9EUKA|nr:hypothetical protein BLNAU_16948 [Blattamonas nauphoetae]
MKTVILFFSNTGSTKSMAVTFQKHLEGAGHSVSLHDGFSILKEYLAAGEKEVTPLLSNYRGALKEADIVGIGSYVFLSTIPKGVETILTKETTPTSLFAKMKYYFSFSSFGHSSGEVTYYLATYLHKKNEFAKYLGSVSQRDPVNDIPRQPPRGRIDEVPTKELKKVDDFGKDLVARLNGGKLPPMHKILTTRHYPADAKPGDYLGPIKIDSEKCTSCLECVTVCPYNALAKPEEGAAVKIPVWDGSSCYGCSRCFNLCPVRAIEFPKVRSEKKEQYFWGRSDPELVRQPIPCFPILMCRAVTKTDIVILLILIVCLQLIPFVFQDSNDDSSFALVSGYS